MVEEGTCAIAQSEPASKFTAHRAVVPAIAWLLYLIPPQHTGTDGTKQ